MGAKLINNCGNNQRESENRERNKMRDSIVQLTALALLFCTVSLSSTEARPVNRELRDGQADNEYGSFLDSQLGADGDDGSSLDCDDRTTDDNDLPTIEIRAETRHFAQEVRNAQRIGSRNISIFQQCRARCDVHDLW